jgi:hypothetical protein
MRRFVAALLRQSALIVSCRRGKERGESERNACVKELLADVHRPYVMSQDLGAMYRLPIYTFFFFPLVFFRLRRTPAVPRRHSHDSSSAT